MHQPYRSVLNSQVNEICLNISQRPWANNVVLLGLAVHPSVFLHSTPSFDFSFGWIWNRSELNSYQTQLNWTGPRSTQNRSQDSYLYLSATEGKIFANESSSGSYFAHQHPNKKNCKTVPYRWLFFGNYACKLPK